MGISKWLKSHSVRMTGSALTGLVATGVDLASLFALVEIFGLAPTVANVPSLILGSVIQFLGNRHVVFAKLGKGKISRQVPGFVVAEAISLAMNALGFYLVLRLTTIPYGIARPLVTLLVFGCFSYPLWNYIFSSAARRR